MKHEAELHAALFGRAAAVVWQGSDVFDRRDFHTQLRQGADGSFTAAAGSFYKYVGTFHAGVQGYLTAISGGSLCGVGSVLLGTAEAHFTGRAPGDHLTGFVGNGNDDVIEGGADVHVAVGVHLYDAFFRNGFG